MKTISEIIAENKEKYSHIYPLLHTDKNSSHSYEEIYTDLLSPIRLSTQKFLEIGILGGSSLQLWKELFENATIYGCDNNISRYCVDNDDRIVTFEADAYTNEFVDSLDNDFDIIIDDGPHTLESMCFFVKHFSYKVRSGGLLIIEDIQDIRWIPEIIDNIPDKFKNGPIQIYDLRHVKDRWDDILLILKI